jgi:hypothetical protein
VKTNPFKVHAADFNDFDRSLLFQSEGVNVLRSRVTKQQRRVFRIETHPIVEQPREMESLQVANALRLKEPLSRRFKSN